MNTHAVPATILTQLGGNRFLAMTGAKNLVGSQDALTFKMPRNPAGVKHVRVALTALDLYTVEVFGNAAVPRDSATHVYADGLRAAFTRLTGFDTSL